MLNVSVKTIPHRKQKYNTVGDYLINGEGDLVIRISDLKNWKMEALITIHEIIEILLVKDRKIKIKDIDNFDIKFEKNKKKGDYSEPGNNKRAPYYKEHQFSTKIEKMLAKELNVDWREYNNKLDKLSDSF